MVRVDLGLWHASPATYRDTVTGAPPSTIGEPRFEVIASSTTDAVGRFTFEHLPRRMPFALRAIPADSSPYHIGYGVSLFGLRW